MTAGGYQSIRRLAVGGMAEIFLARQRGPGGFDRLVVVKRLLPQLVESGDVANMFFDEARIVANLVHPNIVQIYELGTEDGQPFLALEYVSGVDVAQIFERRDQHAMRREVAAHIVAETARALDFAHRAVDADGKPLGIVHRDVSPHNVMVSRTGDVKLMDFGIAKARSRLQRTDTGMVKGKVAYMSPEQIRGDEVDPRSDVFAAGVLLWELTVGQRLFAGQNDAHTITRVLAGAIPTPRSIDAAYPEDLDAIVMAALAADRDARTATAGALEAALRGWLATRGGVAKSELADLVTRWFPQREITEPIPRLIATRELDSATETAAVRADATTLPDRPSSRARGETDAPQAVPSRPRTIRPRRRAIVFAIAALAAVGAWAVSRAVSSGSDATPAEPRAPTVAPVAIATSPDAAPAAGSSTLASNDPPTPPPPAKRPGPTPRRPPVQPSTPTAEPTPPPAAAPDPPSDGPPEQPPGVIAVDADDWGNVSIDRIDRGPTPFQGAIAAGRHDIVIAIKGKNYRGTATVESSRKTKCRVKGDALACDAPQR